MPASTNCFINDCVTKRQHFPQIHFKGLLDAIATAIARKANTSSIGLESSSRSTLPNTRWLLFILFLCFASHNLAIDKMIVVSSLGFDWYRESNVQLNSSSTCCSSCELLATWRGCRSDINRAIRDQTAAATWNDPPAFSKLIESLKRSSMLLYSEAGKKSPRRLLFASTLIGEFISKQSDSYLAISIDEWHRMISGVEQLMGSTKV